MTGGRVKRIEKFIDTDTFMVTYGDGLANVNINDLVAFHQGHRKLATLTATSPPSRYGILELTEGDQVERFREKVQTEWINGGFLVFNRRVFDYLDPGCILESGAMEKLAAEKQLMAFRHEGFWIGMDTYREYEMLNQMWDADNAPWKVWGGASGI
jgi:glucose-1-phosphate cytidylyltransferase